MEFSTIGIVISLAIGIISLFGHFINWGIGLRGVISPLWSSHNELPLPSKVAVHGFEGGNWIVSGEPQIVLMNRAPFHLVVVEYKPGTSNEAEKGVWFELKDSDSQVPFVIRPHEAVKLILKVHLEEAEPKNNNYSGSLCLRYKCASFICSERELLFKYHFKVKESEKDTLRGLV